MPANPNAVRFVQALETYRSPEQREKYRRYFKLDEGQYGEGDVFIGVRMGQVFAVAKEFIDMPPEDIEKLLESPIHEVRAGATSIMDKQGCSKKTTESRRKVLFDLYLRRTDRIDNWDLVDLAAPYVVGRYLSDNPNGRVPDYSDDVPPHRGGARVVSKAPSINTGASVIPFRVIDVTTTAPPPPTKGNR